MMKRNAQLKASFLISILFLFAHCTMGAAADSDITIEQAIVQLEQSIDQSQNLDSGHAVREAAALLEYAFKRDGLESAGGHLTLGNAYFIGQDLGRAILHYRKGS